MGVEGNVPVVGSPSQALRKKGSGVPSTNGQSKRPDRLTSIEAANGGNHHPGGHMKGGLPQVLRPLGVETLGFDPRKTKDSVENGEVSKLKGEINQRGTAIAKQQCLAVNLVQLLSQVVKFYSPPDSEAEVATLPPVEEIFQFSDQGIYDMLHKHYQLLYSTYRARERSLLLPGLSSLFSVAEEKKTTPRRGLRGIYTIIKDELASFPTYNLGTNNGHISELFAVSSQGCYPSLVWGRSVFEKNGEENARGDVMH